MRTKNNLFILCLLLMWCQGCVKELHELPPRPSLVVKLNGVEKDSLIVAPGEEIKVDIDFIANQGVIREVYVKDNAGIYLKGFPLTMDSTELLGKSHYSYSFRANEYLPDGGTYYQAYHFQVVCKDNNRPKQLINKTITILVAEPLKSYTVTLGAQENKEWGGFLNITTGEVFTLEQVRQMNLAELQQIEICYFYGEEDEVESYYNEQRLLPLAGKYNYIESWHYLTEKYEALRPYAIPLLEQIKPESGNKNKVAFTQAMINASPQYIDEYRYTTDLLNYRNPISSNASTHPVWQGIYILSLYKCPSWPEDEENKEFCVAVYHVKEIVPGKEGYIVLDIKAAPRYIY